MLPMHLVKLHQLDIGKDDRIGIIMVTREATDETLENGIHDRLARNTLIQDTEMILDQSLGTTQLLLDEEEGML